MTWLIGLIAITLLACWIVARKVLPKRRGQATLDLAGSIQTLAVGEFVVRRAAAPDVVRILETMDQAFIEANGWNQDTADSTAEQLRTHAPDQLGYVSVCDRDGSMLGYGLIHGVTHSRSRCALAFSLHPTRRSQGLGPGALAAVIQALQQAGARKVLIGTRQSNAAMISCAKQASGVEVSRTRTRLPDGSHPRSIWFKHLSQKFRNQPNEGLGSGSFARALVEEAFSPTRARLVHTAPSPRGDVDTSSFGSGLRVAPGLLLDVSGCDPLMSLAWVLSLPRS